MQIAYSKSVFIALLAIVSAAVISFLLMTNQPTATARPAADNTLSVTTTTLAETDYTVLITSNGTVQPAVQSQLIAEINGTVIDVSDQFVNGARVKAGDLLIRLDASNYRNALIAAQANYADASTRLAQEQTAAEQAARDWQRLKMDGEPTDLLLRKPQLRAARLQVEAAQAAIADAELNIQRTIIKAPYSGRITNTNVNLGQFLNLGAPIATLYQEGTLEVELPLSQREFAMLDTTGLSSDTFVDPATTELIDTSEAAHFAQRPAAVEIQNALNADTTEAVTTWPAYIHQIGSQFDPVTRHILITARLLSAQQTHSETSQQHERHPEKPDLTRPDLTRPDLLPGEYVIARITGKTLKNVFVIPNTALKQNRSVYLLENGGLYLRNVNIIWSDEDVSVVHADQTTLKIGDQLVISPLGLVPEGTPARTTVDEPQINNRADLVDQSDKADASTQHEATVHLSNHRQ